MFAVARRVFSKIGMIGKESGDVSSAAVSLFGRDAAHAVLDSVGCISIGLCVGACGRT